MKRTPFFQRLLPYRFYYATIILVVLNIIMALLPLVAPNIFNAFIRFLVLVPNDIMSFTNPWSLVSHLFVHADIRVFPAHLIFNMFTLLLFGTVIERKLGSHEFLLYYFLTGILTGLLIAFLYPLFGWGDAQVVGASGAIYALMLAYASFYPHNKLLIWGIIPVKAWILVLGLALFAIFASIFNIMGDVSHLGHLGGLIFGFLYFIIRLRINPVKEIIHTRRYYQ